MTIEEELIELERAGWVALSTSGDAVRSHYGRVLADEILMLLPGGMVIDDRSGAIDSMSGAPWSSYELSDERVLRLGDDGAVVAYRAVATRSDAEYAALFNSTYVRRGGSWRLAVHQQTPV